MGNSKGGQQFEWARNIPCRNVLIHGFCKYETKGCAFNHELARKQKKDSEDKEKTLASRTIAAQRKKLTLLQPASPRVPGSLQLQQQKQMLQQQKQQQQQQQQQQPQQQPQQPDSRPLSHAGSSQFNFNTPAFTPSKYSRTSSPSLDSIPSFVPSTGASQDSPANSPRQGRFNPESAPAFQPVSPGNGLQPVEEPPRPTIMSAPVEDGIHMGVLPGGAPVGPMYSIQQAQAAAEKPFYQQTNLFPINYHLYAPQPPPHVEMNKKPNERTVNDMFIPASLRQYLQQKNEASLQTIPNNQLNLPLHIGPYHTLYPIDKHFDKTEKSFGYPATIFKCVSDQDGRLYCMRRLEGVPITFARFLEPIKRWMQVDCANVVKVYDAMTTKAFGDISLVVLYDYYPMSLNILETHFYRIGNRDPELITEDVLWSYLVQLANASAEIHKIGLYVGSYDPSKIIATNEGRIRLSACGISDIVEACKAHNQFQNGNNLKPDGSRINASELQPSREQLKARAVTEQQKDLSRLGTLILNLAKSTIFLKEEEKNLSGGEVIKRLKCTQQLKDILEYMLDPESNWKRFMELLAPKILKVSNGFQNAADYMEATLTKEVENARLVRLLTKLDVISERPEFTKDGSWSETGSRYPIKLFKDFVFHQVDESGKPVVDLTHVVNCLNKLDAGVDENLLLVSPDEMTCLVMSYKRLKQLVDDSFRQLAGEA